MNDKIKIYIKPTCSTCRKALKILNEKDKEFDSVNYYETELSKKSVIKILDLLDEEPKTILRKKEKIYKELGLSEKKLTKNEVADLVIKYPDLLERPIVVKGDKAVVARPVDRVVEIID